MSGSSGNKCFRGFIRGVLSRGGLSRYHNGDRLTAVAAADDDDGYGIVVMVVTEKTRFEHCQLEH